jgi:hypothetical protein
MKPKKKKKPKPAAKSKALVKMPKGRPAMGRSGQSGG